MFQMAESDVVNAIKQAKRPFTARPILVTGGSDAEEAKVQASQRGGRSQTKVGGLNGQRLKLVLQGNERPMYMADPQQFPTPIAGPSSSLSCHRRVATLACEEPRGW